VRKYIPTFDAHFPDEDRTAAIQHLLQSNYWTSDKKVDKFERKFSARLGRSFATMTNSGSSALLAAIYAMGWKPGDRIITPAVTFPTAISPLLWFGLVPVLVDVDDTLNIDPQKMEDSIKAVGGVEGAVIPHTLGNPVDPQVWDFFSRAVEDCCDALGSTINGQQCGTFGTVSCFSFYPAHHITTIEGGMAVSRSSAMAEQIRQFVNWGRACWCRPGSDNSCGKRHESVVDGIPWDHKYEFVSAGGNFKPGFDIQGLIGLRQLDREEEYRERRGKNHATITKAIEPASDLIRTVVSLPGSHPNWFGYPIGLAKQDRKEVIANLEQAGVGTRLIFGGNMGRHRFLDGRFIAPIALTKSDEVMRGWFVVACNHTVSLEEAQYIGDTVRWAVTG
jgi:CDP-6-deoxy-D-xylo-4-hexulose-3-dehydrase